MAAQKKTNKTRSKPLQKNLKNGQIIEGGKSQTIKNNKLNEGYSPLLEKPIRINKVSSARRLLSKIIYEFQCGTINNQNSKDLCYLLISYVNICSQVDFEERLKNLENKFK